MLNNSHTPLASVSSSTNLIEKPEKTPTGAKEALTSLGLLCLGGCPRGTFYLLQKDCH